VGAWGVRLGASDDAAGDDVAGEGWPGDGVAAGAVAPSVGAGVSLGDGLAVLVGAAVCDGAGDHDRVGVGNGVTGPVGVGVGFAGVPAVAGDAGRTTTYKASTPRNSPMSTMVDVRGRPLMTRLPSRGRCQARRPR
jgi:hypothetical protein